MAGGAEIISPAPVVVTQRGEADVKAKIRNSDVRVSCHAYNAPADVVLAASVLEPLMAPCDPGATLRRPEARTDKRPS
jgi:hypothetical protein